MAAPWTMISGCTRRTTSRLNSGRRYGNGCRPEADHQVEAGDGERSLPHGPAAQRWQERTQCQPDQDAPEELRREEPGGHVLPELNLAGCAEVGAEQWVGALVQPMRQRAESEGANQEIRDRVSHGYEQDEPGEVAPTSVRRRRGPGNDLPGDRGRDVFAFSVHLSIRRDLAVRNGAVMARVIVTKTQVPGVVATPGRATLGLVASGPAMT
jgi:hypothetical protein